MTKHTPYKCGHALEQQLLRWALSGETGRSSMFMAGVAAFGRNFEGRQSQMPADLYDFERCETMVNACLPFSAAFDELRKVSPVWCEFVDRWDAMVSCVSYKDYERIRSEILDNHQ